MLVTVEREDMLPEYATDEQMPAVRRKAASEALETALEAQYRIQQENEPDPEAETAAKAAEGLRLLQMLKQ